MEKQRDADGRRTTNDVRVCECVQGWITCRDDSPDLPDRPTSWTPQSSFSRRASSLLRGTWHALQSVTAHDGTGSQQAQCHGIATSLCACTVSGGSRLGASGLQDLSVSVRHLTGSSSEGRDAELRRGVAAELTPQPCGAVARVGASAPSASVQTMHFQAAVWWCITVMSLRRAVGRAHKEAAHDSNALKQCIARRDCVGSSDQRNVLASCGSVELLAWCRGVPWHGDQPDVEGQGSMTDAHAAHIHEAATFWRGLRGFMNCSVQPCGARHEGRRRRPRACRMRRATGWSKGHETTDDPDQV